MSDLLGELDLRALVREVLRDSLPPQVIAKDTSSMESADTESITEKIETISIDTADQLDLFVQHLAHMCEDPAVRAGIQDGRLSFKRENNEGVQTSVANAENEMKIERGAVTERQILDASKSGSRLILGRKAILTPLARDRARSLGVVVEREE